MRLLSAMFAAAVLCAAQDPREIVRRAVENDRAAQKLALDYTFTERQELREFDGDDRIKRHEVKTFDVTLADGSPYRRLIAREDKPLAPGEERAEWEKLEQSIEQRRSETPEQRSKRLAEWEKRRQKQREAIQELPAAFDFKLLGEDRIEGHAVWVIEATPRPGYRPRSLATRFLPKLVGKLWIEKAGNSFVKLEAEVVDTVTVGGILLRLHKGTRFAVDQTRVNDELWLPKRIYLRGSGRIALVKRIAAELNLTYRDYRKFSADSRVISYENAERGPR